MGKYKHTDENGYFKSEYPKDTVGYSLDMMEWIYYHPNINKHKKLELLLPLEEHHTKHLIKMFPSGNFKWKKWSDKLK